MPASLITKYDETSPEYLEMVSHIPTRNAVKPHYTANGLECVYRRFERDMNVRCDVYYDDKIISLAYFNDKWLWLRTTDNWYTIFKNKA